MTQMVSKGHFNYCSSGWWDYNYLVQDQTKSRNFVSRILRTPIGRFWFWVQLGANGKPVAI